MVRVRTHKTKDGASPVIRLFSLSARLGFGELRPVKARETALSGPQPPTPPSPPKAMAVAAGASAGTTVVTELRAPKTEPPTTDLVRLARKMVEDPAVEIAAVGPAPAPARVRVLQPEVLRGKTLPRDEPPGGENLADATIEFSLRDLHVRFSTGPASGPRPAHPGRSTECLAQKRIAAIGFAPQEAAVIERTFAAQSSLVHGLAMAEVALDGANVSHVDLLIIRAGEDLSAATAGTIESLVKRGFPTLVTGSRRILASLVPLHKDGVVDLVNEPWDADELVWRASGLVERTLGRKRRPDIGKVRILLADDDVVTRSLVSATLTRCGMECITVEHGGAALDWIRGNRPDAVVLDVVMPCLDGFQVLAEVRRDPALAALPVMMLTSRQAEPDILRGFGLGADDYMTKPFSPMEVAARLKRLVER